MRSLLPFTHEAFLFLFFCLSTGFSYILLPGAAFILKLYISYFSCLTWSFLLLMFIRVNANSHITESVLGFFQTSSANRICRKLFTLASGRLFRQGQKAATFFTELTQDQSLGHILIFSFFETSSSEHCQHRCPPCFYQFVPLLFIESVYCFPNPNFKSPHFSKQQHGKACYSQSLVPASIIVMALFL